MQLKMCLLLFSLASFDAVAQMAIHDRAVVAQQERMVYKEWDKDKFYPKPNRILGIPTNPLWYLTWALHPNYPKTDLRPLSPSGVQTQRLALALAMQNTTDYYKKEADTVGQAATGELIRISGELAEGDLLYQLYYKKELSTLDQIDQGLMNDVPPSVHRYLQENGALTHYTEKMEALSERYNLARKVDMERGQRILMYHRLLQEMRQCQKSWEKTVYLAQQAIHFQEMSIRNKGHNGSPSIWPSTGDDKIIEEIIDNRTAIR